MLYFKYFSCRGRTLLADVLGVSDPFGMAPADIVERVIANGYTPGMARPKSAPWRTIGVVTEVRHEDHTFLVASSRSAEEISVQEIRATAHDPVE